MIRCVGVSFLLKIAVTSAAAVSSNTVNDVVAECLAEGNITSLADHLLTSTCCKRGNTEWLVRNSEKEFRCEENKCAESGGFMFNEKCRTDVYDEDICGEDALGERLFVGEDGVAFCDCDKGWVRFKGKCYQEFTPAFCHEEGQILKLNTRPEKCGTGLCFPEELDIFLEGMEKNFTCIENPCPTSSYPHWSTWNETVAEEGEVVCHKTESDLVDCEVLVDYNYEDKPLYCCKDRDCYFLVQNPEDFDDYDIFDVHTVIPSKAKACKKGATWSVRANRCVETFGKK